MKDKIIKLELHKSNVNIFIYITQILSIFLYPLMVFLVYFLTTYTIKFFYFKIINKKIKNLILNNKE